MGLDCTAFKNIRQMNEDEIQYEEYKDEDDNIVDRYPLNGREFFINPDFPHAAEDIIPNAVYTFEEKYGWRAGSYSGYNEWRTLIAQVAGWKDDQDAWDNGNLGDPFFELIMFSDCEGTLGTTVCQKLLQDFLNFEDKYNEMIGDNRYYKNVYQEWKKGLALAAQNGAIKFH